MNRPAFFRSMFARWRILEWASMSAAVCAVPVSAETYFPVVRSPPSTRELHEAVEDTEGQSPSQWPSNHGPGGDLGIGPVAEGGVPDKDIQGHYVRWKVRGAPIGKLSCPQALGWRCGMAMVITQDGEYLLTGGAQGRVCGYVMGKLTGGPEFCFDHNASVTHISTVLRNRFQGSSQNCNSCQYRRVLVAAGKDIYMWELPEAGESNGSEANLVCKYPQGLEVTSMAVSLNGRWMISGFDNGTIFLWDLLAPCVDGPVIRYKLESHVFVKVLSLAFTNHAEYFASGESAGFVHLWATNDTSKSPTPLYRLYHGASVTSVALNAKGNALYSGAIDGKVVFWDLSQFKYRSTVDHGSPVTQILVTSDGQWLITASSNGIVKMWDPSYVGPFLANEYRHAGDLDAIALPPHGTNLITSDGGNRVIYELSVWDARFRAAQSVESFVTEKATGNVTDIESSYDSSVLYSAHADGVLCVWNMRVRSKTPIMAKRFLSYMQAIEVLENKIVLAKGIDDKSRQVILAIDLVSREIVAKISSVELSSKPCLMAFPYGRRFVSCGSNSVYMWDLADLKHTLPVAKFAIHGVPQVVSVTHDAKWILAGTSQGISAWSVKRVAFPAATLLNTTTKPETGLAPDAVYVQCGSTWSLETTPDSRHFVGGHTGGMVCLYEVSSTNTAPLAVLHSGDGHDVNSVDVTINRLGLLQIVSGGRQAVCYWEIENVEDGRSLSPTAWFNHFADEISVDMSVHGEWLYTGASDGTVKGWFVLTTAEYVWALINGFWCKDLKCSLEVVESKPENTNEVELPMWLDATPIRNVHLSGMVIASLSPMLPVSTFQVNLSNTKVRNDTWKLLSKSWFMTPDWVDISGTDNPYLPSISGEIPARRLPDEPCRFEGICLQRGRQGRHLCATTFVAVDGNTKNSVLDDSTVIYVDYWKENFREWLCDCPAGYYGSNGATCRICPTNCYCPAASLTRLVAENVRPRNCPQGSTIQRMGGTSVTDCRCTPGFFSISGTVTLNSSDGNHSDHEACRRCSAGRYTKSHGSTSCSDCPLGWSIGENHGEALCFTLDWTVVLLLLDVSTMLLIIVWAVGRQVRGIDMDDIRKEGEDIIVRTCGRAWISDLHWPAKVEVRFRHTGHPLLDQSAVKFKAQCLLGGYRFRVLNEKGDPYDERVDSSQGTIKFAFPFLLLFSGRPLPACLIVPLMLAIALAVAKTTHVGKRHIAISVVLALVIAGLLRICGVNLGRNAAIRRKTAEYCQRIRGDGGEPNPCPRGPGRAVTAEQLWFFFEFFKTYIGDRDMYYVNANIVKPMTKPEQLSFAEFVGPSRVTYFVSHYWGTPFQHFVGSIKRHAELTCRRDWVRSSQTASVSSNPALAVLTGYGHTRPCWKEAQYWICSLSNNQWKVSKELGNGDWARSSFYLALTSETCRATVMVIDEEAKPLTRAWCLFEVLQTFILLKQRPDKFAGLLLCTPTGVLNFPGSASVDSAMAVAERLAHIRMQEADASDANDKRMIADLVCSYEGGFDTMNRFIRNSIREALVVIQGHQNEKFQQLLAMLRTREETPSHLVPIRSNKSSSSNADPPPPLRDALIVKHDNGESDQSDSYNPYIKANRRSESSVASGADSSGYSSVDVEDQGSMSSDPSDYSDDALDVYKDDDCRRRSVVNLSQYFCSFFKKDR